MCQMFQMLFWMVSSLSTTINTIIKVIWENHVFSSIWLKKESFIASFVGKVLLFYFFLSVVGRKKKKKVVNCQKMSFFTGNFYLFFLSIWKVENTLSVLSWYVEKSQWGWLQGICKIRETNVFFRFCSFNLILSISSDCMIRLLCVCTASLYLNCVHGSLN